MVNRPSPNLKAALQEVKAQLTAAEERCQQLRIQRNAISIAIQATEPGADSSESHSTEPVD